MDARKRLGWALALGVALLTLGVGPSVARADEATARLHDGGVVSGTIEVYEPGRRVVLRTASGEVVTLTHEQIAELHITTSQPGATGLTAPPPPPSTYQPPGQGESFQPAPSASEFQTAPVGPGAPHVYVVQPNQPYQPPQQPRLRLPSLAAPILMLALGGALIGTGLWMANEDSCPGREYDACDRRETIGFGMFTTGAVLAAVGLFVVLPIQLGKRSRRRQGYDRRFALSPSLDLVGSRYGVAGTLRF